MKKMKKRKKNLIEMAETRKGIPTINLQDFPAQYKQLREACKDLGCFRIVNHNISSALLSEMKEVARSLLDLPSEIKRRNMDVIAGTGYIAPSEANPLYESLGYYDMASSQAVQDFCSKMEASLYQREIIEKYDRAIQELAIDVAKKLAESMGLIGKGNVFQDWPCQLRMNKYNFTPETVGSLGVTAHTDSGFFTILQGDENVGGLEVMDKSGAFVAADPVPGTLLSILETLLRNGKLHGVKHRVQCKEATIRLSIATFVLGPKEAAVEAPEEFVDSEHPRVYLPIIFEDYRKLRMSNNLRAGEALELVRCHS